MNWLERRSTRSNTYYYAVHVEKVGGRRRVRKCYLGPEAYVNVTKLHQVEEGLTLHGLVDRRRAVKYLLRIASYLEEELPSMDGRTAAELASDVRLAVAKLHVVLDAMEAKARLAEAGEKKEEKK